jgi:hypothetical protein
MSEADDALNEMQDWLAELAAPDEAAGGDAGRIEREIAFLMQTIGVQAGQRILLTAPREVDAGYVIYAQEAAASAGAALSYGPGLQTDSSFDALVCLESQLGLAAEADDLALLQTDRDTLKPSGRYLIDVPNREWVVREYVRNVVRTADDGTVYVERSEVDFVSSRNRVSLTAVSRDGARREIESHSRRLYTLTELIVLLGAAGLTFEAAYGGFEGEAYGPEAPRLVLLARKRDV